jgi:hypothetical protein
MPQYTPTQHNNKKRTPVNLTCVCFHSLPCILLSAQDVRHSGALIKETQHREDKVTVQGWDCTPNIYIKTVPSTSKSLGFWSTFTSFLLCLEAAHFVSTRVIPTPQPKTPSLPQLKLCLSHLPLLLYMGWDKDMTLFSCMRISSFANSIY